MRWSLLVFTLSAVTLRGQTGDLLIADFEGDDYGGWTATGTAFGDKPARGTLANQMPVTGFLGKGLVDSFNGGDAAIGTLTSPEFKIERKFISFLIGGGKYVGKTCINLLIDGKIARTATGPNDKAGGSEQLDWHSWDVTDLAGKMAVLQIVDNETGGWGHINVDHIVQSERKKSAEVVSREFQIEKPYMHLPVQNGAAKRRVKFEVEGKTVREFEIELAEAKTDFQVFADVSAFVGKKLKASTVLMADSKALEGIVASDQLPAKDQLYQEKLRPQFHFTARRGWLNDPNGLVYDGKNWHLFFQHNPYGKEWGNMHWGHATSHDLMHWKEHSEALYPREFGDWAFSGSAVLDKDNTSGWGSKVKPPLVLAYTSTGRGECIAYSNDEGMTWKEHDKNPVVKHAGRDPKLVWHAPTKQWIMAVYDEAGGKKQIAFHSSPDLKTWTFQSVIDGFFECPDLFELPVVGDRGESRWILYAADGKYLIGMFDGKEFKKESGKHQLWYGNFYAAQTFDNAPNGRRYQIGWAQGVTFPGMPFNQQMTVPVELTLRKTPEGLRLHAEPADNVSTLRETAAASASTTLDEPRTLPIAGDAFDVWLRFEVAKAKSVQLRVSGIDIEYDAAKLTLSCGRVVAPLKPLDGFVSLRVLVDRGSIEIFANGGAVAMSVAHIAAKSEKAVIASGVGAKLGNFTVAPMMSVWK